MMQSAFDILTAIKWVGLVTGVLLAIYGLMCLVDRHRPDVAAEPQPKPQPCDLCISGVWRVYRGVPVACPRCPGTGWLDPTDDEEAAIRDDREDQGHDRFVDEQYPTYRGGAA